MKLQHYTHWSSPPINSIGIDFDDVIYEFNNGLHAYHNAKYGTNVRRENITSYDIDKVWNCTKEEAIKKVFEFYFTPEHRETPAVPDSAEIVGLLSNNHDLHIITSRADETRQVSLDWLDRHFPKLFKNIIFTGHYSINGNAKPRTKSSVCKELGITLMIEDSMTHAQNLSENGIAVLLLDCPWNQGPLPPSVHRVYSWKEIGKVLLPIKTCKQ